MCALAVTRAKQGQQGHEQIDDVKVERDSGPDILVICVPLDDVVRVIDNVPTEDECCKRAIDHVRELAKREEDLHTEVMISIGCSIEKTGNI